MAYFPTPNVTDVIGLFNNANTITNDKFWNLTMIIIFIVFFLMLKAFSAERAVVVAAFVCAVASFFLSMAGLVDSLMVLVFTILMAGALIFT